MFLWESCDLALPNVVSKIIAFENFCASSTVPLLGSLYRYFNRLKKYDYWFSFSSCHSSLSLDLPDTNNGWKGKFCWVNLSSVYLTNILWSLLDLDNEIPFTSDLYKYLPCLLVTVSRHASFLRYFWLYVI